MDVFIGSIPTLLLLITILANYFDLRAKRIGYETALLSLKEKQQPTSPSLAQIIQDEHPTSDADRISTPDEFWLWAGRRCKAHTKGLK